MTGGSANKLDSRRNASLILNEWICVTGQYEKTLMRIGRDLYHAHKKGLLSDQESVEYCQVLDGIFGQAKEVRSDLNFDLTNIVARRADSSNQQVKKVKRSVGGFVSRQIMAYWDQTNLPKYKEVASGTIQELSNRALSRADRGEPLLGDQEHLRLCKLAMALEKECQLCWQRLVELKKQNKKGASFSTLTVQAVMGFGKFAKKSKHGAKLLKLMKYNETVEKTKLLARFAGRPEEQTLRLQMGFAMA